MRRLVAVIGFVLTATPAAAGELDVAIGQVEVVRAPAPIGTVVIGEPRVADVTVEGDMSVVVFGKSAGETDLILFDQARQVMMTARVTVLPAINSDFVTIRRPGEKGIDHEVWVCGSTNACSKAADK